MSVLIKGFKMPEDCRDCPLEMHYMNCGETRCRAENKILAENFKTIPFDGRPDWCPLVEVPVPHGRLIDYGWVVGNVIKKLGIKDKKYLLQAEKALMILVDEAPTVIEAERRTDATN